MLGSRRNFRYLCNDAVKEWGNYLIHGAFHEHTWNLQEIHLNSSLLWQCREVKTKVLVITQDANENVNASNITGNEEEEEIEMNA